MTNVKGIDTNKSSSGEMYEVFRVHVDIAAWNSIIFSFLIGGCKVETSSQGTLSPSNESTQTTSPSRVKTYDSGFQIFRFRVVDLYDLWRLQDPIIANFCSLVIIGTFARC